MLISREPSPEGYTGIPCTILATFPEVWNYLKNKVKIHEPPEFLQSLKYFIFDFQTQPAFLSSPHM